MSSFASWPGYDLEFDLEQRPFKGFTMKAYGDYRNLRLHAFGDCYRIFPDINNNDRSPLRLQIAVYLTGDRQWLSENFIINVEGGEVDADLEASDSSMHDLSTLRDPLHARRVVGRILSQAGIDGSKEYRRDYENFIGHFVYSAARESYRHLPDCKGVAVLVEINDPREGEDEGEERVSIEQVRFFDEGEGEVIMNVKEDNCVICMEKFDKGARVGVLQCCHVYHERCIDEWFARSSTCPICRAEIPSDD